MLAEFRVSNFRSFENEQVFSMEAGKVRNNLSRVYTDGKFKLLKFMAIYGANASGKSNFLEAFAFAQEIIAADIPKNAKNDFCRVDEKNASVPSHFEFTIKIRDTKYVYGFFILISKGTITREYLRQYKYGSTYKTIFSRDVVTGDYEVDTYFKEPTLNDRLKIYAEDVCQDGSVLFLRLMNQNKSGLYQSDSPINIYKDIYNWFKFKLSVNYPDRPVTSYSYLSDSESVDRIGKLLHAFGTGISKFRIIDIPLEKVLADVPEDVVEEMSNALNEEKKYYEKSGISKIPSVVIRSLADNSMFFLTLKEDNITCQTLEMEHEQTSAMFSLAEESDGTVRLLDLIEVLLCRDTERVYIIDEINRRLHPLLTYNFVQQYLQLADERNIQLIVTTHESRLMDFDLLRKDEIGFVNKDETGRSVYYSMDSFGERFDKKVCKSYFEGKYGAIPKFGL